MPDPEIRVLITAFGLYTEVDYNISESTLAIFKQTEFFKTLPSNVKIITAILHSEPEQMQFYGELIGKYNPTYVIALGHEQPNKGMNMDYEAAAKLHYSTNDFVMCNAVYYEFTHNMEKNGKPNSTILVHLNAPNVKEGAILFSAKVEEAEREEVARSRTELFDNYTLTYAASLQKMVTTLNDIYKQPEKRRQLSIKEVTFMDEFIPTNQPQARIECEKQPQKVPTKETSVRLGT